MTSRDDPAKLTFRSALRGGLSILASQLAVQGIFALNVVFLARMFGPELFGQYAMIAATVGSLGIIGEAALLGVMTRLTARAEQPEAELLALGLFVSVPI